MNKIILPIVICLLAPILCLGQFDSTFNKTGLITYDRGGAFNFTMKDSNKILVIGRFPIPYSHNFRTLACLNMDGTVDHSFGRGGYLSNSFIDIAIKDSSIIIAGHTRSYWKPGYDTYNFICFSFDLKGNTRYDFGENGRVMTDMPIWEHSLIYGDYWLQHPDNMLSSVAVQPDGKIVLFGYSFGEYLTWLRYNPDGTVDSSFGPYGRGFIHYRPHGYLSETNDLAVMPDGRLLSGFMSSDDMAVGVARLLPDGILDTTFNHTGVASYGSRQLLYCKAMCLQADGKVVLGGHGLFGDMFLVRFDSTGAFDLSFGDHGVSHLGDAALSDMALTSDGKIVAAGYDDSNIVITRCLPDGSLDPGFGTGGIFKFNPKPGWPPRSYDIALQADGKILIGGWVDIGDYGNRVPWSFMARLLPDARPLSDTLAGEHQGLLTFYPNPTVNDRLYLEWSGAPVKDAIIVIRDALGRSIFHMKASLETQVPLSMSVSSLAAGTYFLQVSDSAKEIGRVKFVKE